MPTKSKPRLIGDCVEVDGRSYRVVAAFDKPEPHVFVIELGKRKPLPIKWAGSDLSKFGKRSPKLTTLGRLMRQRPASERDVDSQRGDERYKHVLALTSDPDLYDPVKRGPLLRRYAKKINKTQETVLAWLRQFWERGMVPQALRTDLYRSGRVTETTPGALIIKGRDESGPTIACFAPAVGRQRGATPMPANCLVRPNRSKDNPRDDLPPRYVKYLIPDDEKKQIIVIAWRHYGAAAFKSMTGATRAVAAEMYIEKDSDGVPLLDDSGDCLPYPLGMRPTYRQIKRIVDKVKSKSRQYKDRFSAEKFANDVATRFGNKRDDCRGPGDVAEIDVTKLDVFLVDEETRTTIIGKPILVLVVDRWSNLIIGWHLTLDNPSWAEAKLGILSIFSDWKAVGKRLRVAVRDSDLIACGRMPNRLFADRGELLHKGPEQLCGGFSTLVTNAPPLICVAKGLVESLFRTLQLCFRDDIPGYEPPEEFGKRRVKDRSKEACYTMTSLQRILFHRILTHNRSRLKSYSHSAKEILLDLPISPLDIYARDSEVLTGYGSHFDFEYAREQLMTRSTATVTGDGIRFGHCTYQAKECKEWCAVARLTTPFEVNIAYETSYVNEITVYHPKDSSVSFTARLVSADSKRWSNFSHAERHFLHLAELRKSRNNSDTDIAKELTDFLFRKWVTEDEQKATAEAIEAISLAKRKDDGIDARPKERRKRRGSAVALGAPLTAAEELELELSPGGDAYPYGVIKGASSASTHELNFNAGSSDGYDTCISNSDAAPPMRSRRRALLPTVTPSAEAVASARSAFNFVAVIDPSITDE